MLRTSLIAALAASAVLLPHASAKTPPQLTDPKGDYPIAGADVISGHFTTEGTKIIVTLEYAGNPNSQIPYAYQVQFTAGDCDWRGNYFAENDVSGGCRGDDSDAPLSATAKENKIIFTLAAKGKLKPGTKLTGINVNNSVGGVLAGGASSNTGDFGKTDTTYTVGSK